MKKALTIFLCIIVALVVFKVTTAFQQKKLDKAEIVLRKELIKNDSLRKLNEGLYTRLVADTNTVKDLRRLNDSLELKLKNPKTITTVVFVPKEVEKEIDNVEIKDSIVTIKDSYPDSISPFVSYFATVDIRTKESLGKFTFNEIEINLGIGQNKDGTYYVNTKLPDFLEVTDLHVQALPRAYTKPDNFGVLLGAGFGKSYIDDSNFVYIETGIRYKKTYFEIGGSTNQSIYAGLKFEF